MPLNIPALATGEYLPGWLGAVLLENPTRRPRQLCMDLLGTPTVLTDDGVIRGVARLLREGLALPRAEAEQVLLDSTDIRFELAAVPLAHRKIIVAEIVDGREDLARLSLKFRDQRAGDSGPFRRCPGCIAEHREGLGRPYWRLGHQSPVSFVCRRHGEVLQHPSAHVRGLICWIGVDGRPEDWVTYDRIIRKGQVSRYLRLAEIADEIYHPGREIDTRTTEVTLGLAALDLAFLQGEGMRERKSLKRIGEAARRMTQDRLLREYLPSDRATFRGTTASAALHIEALLGTWNSFQERYSEAESLTRSTDRCNSSCSATATGPRIVEKLAAALPATRSQVLECAENLMSACGTNLSPSSGAAMHGSVQKANRRALQLAIQEMPSGSVKQIKSRLRGRYSWLVENDREWLMETLPALWKA